MRSPRRLVAAGVGLMAVALSVSAAPTATADVSVLTVATAPSARIYPPGPIFKPKHVGGDREFAGHGPEVVANATLTGIGNRDLYVELCMNAVETQPDFTRANGCSGKVLLYRAPVGECVHSVSRGTFDELHYTDTDRSTDGFTGQTSGSFVQSWEVVGDTSGDDAGVDTGASIFTHDLTVTSGSC